ncbi:MULTISPECIES: GNAT family N-acetyltransferase [Vibrio]|uniref:GNAT family N-acetyltransferase n=1 Tax=Vibrio TaxID=662 RepID=UPI00084AB416|nr:MULTISPECIES: GNAT family N-acetyltransferase [Vibrio]EHU5194288.1 GNAT family N-acetyltransferase [Vibrio parahaemolyticus]MBH9742472.1 N-acetyltransferase [Vibrio navarrensis]ODY55768.1 GNAT family N-acetyltransferase [Vibrio parahaemolyticus]ODY61656.1 GNAT family N-acetyltransferase [Vibrio parahaemolyticus]ODY66292.1 GNAT family N-acetyltransferase [Vibrio parahaemolyticus]
MEIRVDNLEGTGVLQLLEEHLRDMYATSPAESVHALDVEALKHPSITFWCAEKNGVVQGCIALKELASNHAEIKSMRTATSSRNQGIASQLLSHVVAVAKTRNYEFLSLETGSMDYFLAARKLYEKHGFIYCGPFGDYQPDPNSCFMTRKL